MNVLGERAFTPDQQSRFAALSGDANPIHMDAVGARRMLFGAPVVHGVHLLCWALDCWMNGRRSAASALERLTVKFTRGVLLGESVRVVADSQEEGFALILQSGQLQSASIRGKLGPAVNYSESLPPVTRGTCREKDYAEVSMARGCLPLTHDAQLGAQLFPHLSASVPPFQLATLLATTRLVGMECPGLHSLFVGMDLSFTSEPTGPPEMRFFVDQIHRVGQVRLAVEGPGMQGQVRALLRPRPCRQSSAAELGRVVKKDEFCHQRAVVIGGSRGLGEVTAKLLAMGGADVLITYRNGKDDAQGVADDILAAGGRCEIAAFDCRRPSPIASPRPFTHLYYFATPNIAVNKTVNFSRERFAEYSDYYLTGFAQTVIEIGQDIPELEIFYPSTVFLDEPAANMTEYCSAKAAGEELCRQLAKRLSPWRFYYPRLPRLLTDQNNGLLRPSLQKSEIVMLDHLRRMNQNHPKHTRVLAQAYT